MTFRLLFPGRTHKFQGRTTPCTAKVGDAWFFRVEARCEKCGMHHLVLDVDLHGWNGFVCHDERQSSLARPPLVAWKCTECKGEKHRALVAVSSQGRRDFREEAGPGFRPGDWAEGFESLSLEIQCRECGLASALMACETM